MGRPTLLTPQISDRIVLLLKRGNFLETAAAMAGVDRLTLRRWLRRGASGEEQPYASFSARVLEAEASAEGRHVDTLSSASKVDWRCAAWILSRKNPERWGDRIRQTVDIDVSGPASPAQAARLVREAFGDKVISEHDEQASEPDEQ